MAKEPVTRVVAVGLGAIGTAALERCAASDHFAVVAAVDPLHASEVVAGVEVVADLDELADVDAEVALVATGSSLEHLVPLATELLGRGFHVVSTCEVLAFPWYQDATLARELDERARSARRVVLGCGVNPGFMMDVVPGMLTSASLDPRTISVARHADLARRRSQLRDKVGVGRPLDAWRAEAAERGYGHHGLAESACLCALAAGWEVPDRVEFTREPVDDGHGTAAGIRELAELRAPGGRLVRLELVFAMGGTEEDRIEVDGTPPLRVVFDGGVQGDDATVARMLSSTRVVGALAPGLRLPVEAPAWAATSPGTGVGSGQPPA